MLRARLVIEKLATFTWSHDTPWLLWDRILTHAEKCKLTAGMPRGTDPFRFVLKKYLYADRIWRAVHGGSIMRAVLEMAFAFEKLTEPDFRWLLRLVGEDRDEDDTSVEELVATRKIVLIEENRALYVDGKRQNQNGRWTDKQWQFLRGLADAAKRGAPYREDEFYHDPPGAKNTFSMFKKRIVELAPGLGPYIKSVPPKRYRLMINAVDELEVVEIRHCLKTFSDT